MASSADDMELAENAGLETSAAQQSEQVAAQGLEDCISPGEKDSPMVPMEGSQPEPPSASQLTPEKGDKLLESLETGALEDYVHLVQTIAASPQEFLPSVCYYPSLLRFVFFLLFFLLQLFLYASFLVCLCLFLFFFDFAACSSPFLSLDFFITKASLKARLSCFRERSE